MKQFADEMRYQLESIKREFSDHLESINANTSEIQGNYEQIAKVEYKVDKLAERIDEITLFLQSIAKDPKKHLTIGSQDMIRIQKLTQKEQCVFNTLYNTDQKYLSYDIIARKCGLTQTLVTTYVSNLIAKGVPIIKRYINNKAHVGLDEEFKELQTKHNIAHISRTVRDYAV